jgi:hypothetical protein
VSELGKRRGHKRDLGERWQARSLMNRSSQRRAASLVTLRMGVREQLAQ